MTNIFKTSVLAAALSATVLAGSAPAMADGYRGGYHHGGDGAGLAMGAGILGLAIGAIVVSSAHHHDHYDDRYYANGGYYPAPYVDHDWAWHDGYYWDHDGNRYGRDGRYHGNDDRGYDRRGYDDRGDRGYQGGGHYGDRGHYEGGRGY